MAPNDLDMAEAGRLVAAAGALLLNEPDDDLSSALQQVGFPAADKKELQQLFFDRLVIPQSGLYLPPYEHVFRNRKFDGGIWHFPPARFDGGMAVERIYQAAGFQRCNIIANPLLSGANIPADHLGFMLAFGGLALQRIAGHADSNMVFTGAITALIERHLGDWVDEFCNLLPLDDSLGYLEALADSVRDAVELLRGGGLSTSPVSQTLLVTN